MRYGRTHSLVVTAGAMSKPAQGLGDVQRSNNVPLD